MRRKPGRPADMDTFNAMLDALRTDSGVVPAEFAEQHGITDRTVRRWLKQVRQLGYRIVRENSAHKILS